MKDSGHECSLQLSGGNRTVHWGNANSKIRRAAAGSKEPKSIESQIQFQPGFLLSDKHER